MILLIIFIMADQQKILLSIQGSIKPTQKNPQGSAPLQRGEYLTVQYVALHTFVAPHTARPSSSGRIQSVYLILGHVVIFK